MLPPLSHLPLGLRQHQYVLVPAPALQPSDEFDEIEGRREFAEVESDASAAPITLGVKLPPFTNEFSDQHRPGP
jgi:hypothetical protein